MVRTHAEERSLVEWLGMQERVLQLWIDEALGAAAPNADLISRLETHHAWLVEQIDYFMTRAAA